MHYSFDECMSKFLAHLERNCYSDETLDGYKKDLLRSFMADVVTTNFSMENVKKEDLISFMDDGRVRGNKPSTVGRRLSTLKSFYKFLVYKMDFPQDVAARIRTPKVYVPLKNVLTEEEIGRILLAAEQLHPRYRLLFSVLYYTGSRLSPVRTLERSHVHMRERIVYFPKVKGGKDQYLPLHDTLCNLFEEYFSLVIPSDSRYVFPSPKYPDQPISPSDVRNKLQLLAERAGVDTSITPHTLRHCTATHLTLRNIPQHTIANILGHADLRSTMRYQHLTVEHLRGAIGEL